MPGEVQDKPALQSKKFIAFLVSQVGFFVLMGMMLFQQDINKVGENLAFMTLTATAGFLAVGYALGQSYVDKFVRVSLIMSGRGEKPEE